MKSVFILHLIVDAIDKRSKSVNFEHHQVSSSAFFGLCYLPKRLLPARKDVHSSIVLHDYWICARK
jgi:hypothetical protein